MTTTQSEALYRVLSATIGAIMDDANVRHAVKVELQQSLFQLSKELGVVKPVMCLPYKPTVEEEKRMVNDGEA